MKMVDAKAQLVAHAGYRVHFERREGGLLCSDCFPDRDEPGIADLDDAWTLAEQWAAVDPAVYVNVYVIRAWDFAPVPNYELRKLNRHPPIGVRRDRGPTTR
jgi:hypothetical protein